MNRKWQRIYFRNKLLVMVKSLSIISIAIMVLGSCQPSGQTTDNSNFPDGEYNFIKVYQTPVGSKTQADSTVLQFKINMDAPVSGTYRWVVPGKDGKYGTIRGYLSRDTISGRYNYQQEGGNYNDSIQVVLVSERAIVTQFIDNGYKLIDTLVQK